MLKAIYFCIFILVSSSIQAVDNQQLQQQVLEISDKLRCTTCQALSVKDSESAISQSMKLKIRSLLEEGQSEQQVLDYFEQRYGQWILREPKIEGFNYSLYILPAIFLVFGSILILLFGKKHLIKK